VALTFGGAQEERRNRSAPQALVADFNASPATTSSLASGIFVFVAKEICDFAMLEHP
jgi:hypothetical protein